MNPDKKEANAVNIGLLYYPEAVVSGLFAFTELLEMANVRVGRRVFTPQWVSVAGGEIGITDKPSFYSNFKIDTQRLRGSHLDALLIPGFWSSQYDRLQERLQNNSDLISQLKNLPQKTKLWSYCTGVAFLAESGRLENKVATATWWMERLVYRKYPKVNWAMDRTFVNDNDIATASGLNGYKAIALDLIEQECGSRIMRELVDVMVLARPETHAKPITNLTVIETQDRFMRDIIMLVEKLPAREISTKKVADAFHLTERTLSRKIKRASDLSANKLFNLIKLNQASDKLVYTQESTSQISDEMGYSSDATFRKVFKRMSGYNPAEYRRLFGR